MTLFKNFTVLRDELLPVRELSTFHSVQLSILPYDLKTFSTALNYYSIFLRKGGKSRKSNFWNEKLFRMSSYICEDFQDDIPDILSHAQKLHFHFGRKKMFELTFFLVGLIFNEKRPFLFVG